ncbi:MAG: outer membrane protein assembly factor BamD [Chitinispirillia bacterium]|nr:outer membrane protein assembly factor BamD [Chitinispirillia bacterium]
MNVKKMLFLVTVTVAAIMVSGCANSPKRLIKKGLYNCNARFETAMTRIEKRNYNDAIRILDEIKYQCGGSSLMDTVYYHTAMSHFRLKQYADARVEFENLQMNYPRSPFIEESYFRLGQMRYLRSNRWNRDQTETKEALRLLGDYLDRYPNGVFADSARHFHTLSNEKLAEKEFRNAMFYRRQKEHSASLIYFNSLLADFPNSKFIPEATVAMLEALVTVGRVEDARETLDEIETADFSEPLQKRIETVVFRLNQPMNQVPPKRRFLFFPAKTQQPPPAGAVQEPVTAPPAVKERVVEERIIKIPSEPVKSEEKFKAPDTPKSAEVIEIITEDADVDIEEEALPETEKTETEDAE